MDRRISGPVFILVISVAILVAAVFIIGGDLYYRSQVSAISLNPHNLWLRKQYINNPSVTITAFRTTVADYAKPNKIVRTSFMTALPALSLSSQQEIKSPEFLPGFLRGGSPFGDPLKLVICYATFPGYAMVWPIACLNRSRKRSATELSLNILRTASAALSGS